MRARVDAAAVGETIEVPDSEWTAIEPEFRRPMPAIFQPAWYVALEDHARAWLDAPSKRPAVLVASAPAAS